MSEAKETLKAMLQDIIKGREESANDAIHTYLLAKTQEMTGLGEPVYEEEMSDTLAAKKIFTKTEYNACVKASL
jgi:hypothetical protein